MDLLSVHRSTLTTLHISALREPWLHHFSFSRFESLTDLNLSYWSTGCMRGTETRFLAPRLRKFTWSFQLELQDEFESSFDFQEDQELWLRRLAGSALLSRIPLRHIHINYRPADCDRDEEEPRARAPRWPWDFMYRLKGDLAIHGIELTFDEPCMSFDEYSPRPWIAPLGGLPDVVAEVAAADSDQFEMEWGWDMGV